MGHLSDELLLRHLDEELQPSELLPVQNHLNECPACFSRQEELLKTGGQVDDLFLSMPISYGLDERVSLASKLSGTQVASPVLKAQRRNWLWSTAASLAASLLLIAGFAGVFGRHATNGASKTTTLAEDSGPRAANTFEVDGETFWALPYSNPDLPLSVPRIVQMQVPVSSLAEAGMYVEPISSRTVSPERAVVADVLLGSDGQPLGVRLASLE